MAPASSSFTPLNIADDAVPEWMDSFTLAAPPNTDLWRKPPSGDTSTAPILYTALRNPFVAAEVTVAADWELEWDQGGLVIFAGAVPGQNATPAIETPSVVEINLDDTQSTARPMPVQISSTESRPNTLPSFPSPPTTSRPPRPHPPPPAYTFTPSTTKWLKVGLELHNSTCHATSVSATSDGADWSSSSLPPTHSHSFSLRVKIERIGYALWVWYEDQSVGGWKKLREVTWFFWGVEDKSVRVGVYASRPANFGVNAGWGRGGPEARSLCVGFEGLEIY